MRPFTHMTPFLNSAKSSNNLSSMRPKVSNNLHAKAKKVDKGCQIHQRLFVSLSCYVVHPFFARPDSTSAASNPSPSSLHWANASPTCLHGVHLNPGCTSKVAAFDFDGTIVKGRRDIGWLVKCVPSTLNELHIAG